MLLLAALIVPGLFHHVNQERSVPALLKTVMSAQEDFRANDRDGNRVADFWVRDVAGLYGYDPGKGPIQLVDKSIAKWDRTPGKGIYPGVPEEQSSIGYYFASIKYCRESGKRVTYDEKDGRNASRYGVVAFPVERPGPGRMLTFIANESRTIFSKDTHGQPPEEFPEDPVRENWVVVD